MAQRERAGPITQRSMDRNHPLLFFRCKMKHLFYIKKDIRLLHVVLWCSGYHICLTRRRSPVRNWVAPAVECFHILIKLQKILMFENKLWRFCGVVVITSASHAEGPWFETWQNLSKNFFKKSYPFIK